MNLRTAHMGRALAIAAAAALLVSALPASVVAAAPARACKVSNLDQDISRNTLQRAVWAADPGDRLMVKGTCVGTTLIRKDLEIGWVRASSAPRRDSGPPTLRSGSWRPAIVVDPSVDHLVIHDGLKVRRGIVVDDIDVWKGDAKPVPTAWSGKPASAFATSVSPAGLRACRVEISETGATFGRIQRALAMASPGDHLTLRGKCVGETAIDKSLHIEGWRLAISAVECRPDGSCSNPQKADSGPPTLTKVSVDASVDKLTLKRLTVPNGFSVREVAP